MSLLSRIMFCRRRADARRVLEIAETAALRATRRAADWETRATHALPGVPAGRTLIAHCTAWAAEERETAAWWNNAAQQARTILAATS